VNLCVISDCLWNDITVHVYIGKGINYLKMQFSKISHFHYFSDGSAGQYKNLKNFLNLCHQEENFGITAEWNFFFEQAMESHLVMALEAQQNDWQQEQVCNVHMKTRFNTPEDLFNFCNDNINGIKFFSISKEE
jgi:hypothetical protein